MSSRFFAVAQNDRGMTYAQGECHPKRRRRFLCAHVRKKSALPITEKGTLDGLKSGHTKKHRRFSAVSLFCSGSQDVSVATPCLLLILTCSAGACYPRKRHGLNLLWNQICCLPCLTVSPVSVCIPLRASSHGLQPYTDGLRPCRQQKNITEDSVMSLSCSGSQD